MNDSEKFEQFMQRVMERPLPSNPMARIKMLARELAEGAATQIWRADVKFSEQEYCLERIPKIVSEIVKTPQIPVYEEAETQRCTKYIALKWGNNFPNLRLLYTNGYIFVDSYKFDILKSAFELLEEVEPASIFISYRRKDSSAFALLISKYLKEHGLAPFVDMSLVPGEDWHAGLKERIQKQEYDFLILVLGKKTLDSEYVIKEMTWALEAELKIIPIWHNGFKYETNKWDLTVEVHECLSRKHAIEVKEESALGYETAIIELLNKNFGITP